jgi:hypothetical protein
LEHDRLQRAPGSGTTTRRMSWTRRQVPVMMHAVRVITWNMGLGWSRRFVRTHEEAWRYLLGLRPDLAFLQETFPPHWAEGEGRVVRDPFEKWGSFARSRSIWPSTVGGRKRILWLVPPR